VVVSRPTTLVVDIGGTSIKAAAFDDGERPLTEPVRVPMSYPVEPGVMVERVGGVASMLPDTDQVSIGFPGVVRSGQVMTAPGFVGVAGLGSTVVPELLQAWTGFDLAGAVTGRLGRPTLLANDADLQGLGVAEGIGLELVVTLGAGFGTALLRDGDLCPHLEFAHDLFRCDETYNEQLGDAARRRVGATEWTRRVQLALDALHRLVSHDRVWVLGGNVRWLTTDLGPNATVVDHAAGLLGGVRLWRSSGSAGRPLAVTDPRSR
jgi:polyphosphate glucokinase